ncbi:helix-turn-helix domain-containing protein [Alkalibacterium sp. AK22]|uniref:helix-turn-helix domain-containing protein n=1 Tax=Alkalibacterium sp. AK22 TaxID=1229520 RepID=UPI000553A206|nr:helix-turn-helix domain-containing protein [Alkalibacterium sp. AK22]
MAKLSLDLSSDLEEELKILFKRSAREVFNEMSKQELNSKSYFNLTEATQWLGISYNTLGMWISDYDLPVVRIAGKKFISKESLITFMQDHEK